MNVTPWFNAIHVLGAVALGEVCVVLLIVAIKLLGGFSKPKAASSSAAASTASGKLTTEPSIAQLVRMGKDGKIPLVCGKCGEGYRVYPTVEGKYYTCPNCNTRMYSAPFNPESEGVAGVVSQEKSGTPRRRRSAKISKDVGKRKVKEVKLL